MKKRSSVRGRLRGESPASIQALDMLVGQQRAQVIDPCGVAVVVDRTRRGRRVLSALISVASRRSRVALPVLVLLGCFFYASESRGVGVSSLSGSRFFEQRGGASSLPSEPMSPVFSSTTKSPAS